MQQKLKPIDIKDIRITLSDTPDVIIDFHADSGMSVDKEFIDKLTLRYHGLIIDLAAVQVIKQGSYLSGSFAWRVRAYKINIDNSVAIKFIREMAAIFPNVS
jgi:hypothetical protein